MKKQLVFLFLLLTGSVFARDFYVSPTGSGSLFTLASPGKVQDATLLTNPGDTVYFMNGAYASFNITLSGTAALPITFKNYPGHTPVIQTAITNWQGIYIKGSYIVIDGLTVRGLSASQTLTAALAQGGSCTNSTGSLEAQYNTNGIQVDGRVSSNNPLGTKFHHITIKNSTIYECGGSGIQILQADYITIENNKCYNNAWYSIYAPSGISIYQSYNSDVSTGTKMIVRNNICYGNRMYVPWPSHSCQFTDGNGIIIDDTKNTQSGSTLGTYNGRTLVANNIVYNNGGSGIHSFSSEHVDIINNTAYLNSQTPEIDNGEIFPQNSNDVKIFNNILVAASDQKINSNMGNGTNYYDYNLHFGGNSTALIGANPIIGDPKLTNPASADFTLQATSPAINTGIATFNGVAAPTTDIIYGTRTIGSGYDIGAYEYPFVVITPPPTELAQFTPGNLVVSLHDAGTGNVITTGGTHRTVNIQEYKTDGSKVNAAMTLNNFVTDERRIAHEAQMQLSVDNKYLLLAGRIGAETTNFNTARQTYGAAIYRIQNNKTIESTIFSGGSSGVAADFYNVGIRNVASANGATLYTTTSGAAAATGTRIVTHGTNTSTTNYSALANRYIGIYGSDNITVDGTNPVVITINGTVITKPTGPSYDGVVSAVMFDVNPSEPGNDLMYLAQRNSGIIKMYKSSGTWLIAGPTGTYNNGSFNGPVSIVGRIENGKPTLYGIKIDGTTPNAASQLIKVVDNVAANLDWNTSGQYATFSILATSASNITFRGVSFTPTDYCWTGTTSTDFNTPTNWKAGVVPPTGAIIYVPNSLTNYPLISGNVSINGGVIESGAKLTVAEGKVLTNTGTITNNGDLILKSSAAGTASLVSDAIVNNVTLQRYLTSNQRGWRLLSNPLASTTFSALATASTITLGIGFTGEYLTAPGLGSWTSTNGTVAMENNKAYKVFITGKTGEAPAYATGPTNVTLVNKGTAANTAPAQIATTSSQFYLVANPFTAPISLKTILALPANSTLSKTVSYYDPTVASTDVKLKFGGYITKDTSGSLVSGDANDVVIPPMGAIFVQASSNGTLNVPTTAIFTGTNNSGTYTHKTAQAKVAATNALKLEVSSSGTYYDAVTLRFKEVGTAGSNIDFGKLPNSILDAYTIAGTQKKAVSELELAVQTIPLGINSIIQKDYTFKVIENTIPAGFEAVLVDNVLNTNTVLVPNTTYNFAIDSTPASQGDARFAINLRTAGSLGVKANELNAQIQVYPNPSHGEFNISNTQNQKEGATIEIIRLNGQLIHTQKLNTGTTTIQTKSWATGVYILKASSNGTETIKKLIIQ
jgi:hypothetical protein